MVEHIGIRKDCILIAGCGWGKSLIFTIPLLLWPNAVIVVISPLKALCDEQAGKLMALGIKSLVIKSNPLGDDLSVDMKEVYNGNYRALFMSPEIIFSSSKINSLWQHHEWRNRLQAVVIDEVHCICSWGTDFRPDYSKLGKLRSRVPFSVPFIAMTATLPHQFKPKVMEVLRFKDDTTVINLGNDRPNIAYKVVVVDNVKKFRSLEFLVDSERPTKTIVYFESRDECDDARIYLRNCENLPKLLCDNTITAYHAGKGERSKNERMELFKSDSEESIRILLATEAVGMGCDINDVIRVVQFGLPKDGLTSLIQRLGRAARNPTLQGEGILILTKQEFESLASRGDPNLKSYVYAEGCRREILSNVFEFNYEIVDNCCDKCSPQLKLVINTTTKPDLSQSSSSLPDLSLPSSSLPNETHKTRIPSRSKEEKKAVLDAIAVWREKRYNEVFLKISDFYDESAVMPDNIMSTLSNKSSGITSKEQLKEFWAPKDDDELLELFNVIQNENKKIDEAKQVPKPNQPRSTEPDLTPKTPKRKQSEFIMYQSRPIQSQTVDVQTQESESLNKSENGINASSSKITKRARRGLDAFNVMTPTDFQNKHE